MRDDKFDLDQKILTVKTKTLSELIALDYAGIGDFMVKYGDQENLLACYRQIGKTTVYRLTSYEEYKKYLMDKKGVFLADEEI